MADHALTVRVYRFDPTRDQEPHYDSFEMPYDEQQTIMGVMKYIAEHHDSSLAFRESCRIGNCLICTVKVNGRKVLSCRETLKDFEGDELVLEPAAEESVIRDLVCTM